MPPKMKGGISRMRASFISPEGRPYEIDCDNLSIIADWMADMIPRIVTLTSFTEWKVRIWASNDKEAKMIGQPFMHEQFLTEDGMRKMENLFRRTREKAFPKKEKS